MDGVKKVEGHDSSSESEESKDEKPDGDYVHFVNAYSQEPKLKEAGLTFTIDHSGRVAKRPTIKDVVANRHVVMATIKGSLQCENNAPQMSAYTIQNAILQFYTKHRLFPQGLSALVPAVVDWALKHGAIIKKLVSRFRRLLKKASGAKNKKLFRMKEDATKIGWPLPSKDKGKPANLAEIPNIAGSRSSTTASSDLGSSDISSASVSSTMCSKLARIASQLEALRIAKASKALKVNETIVVEDDDPNSPDSTGAKHSDPVENENSLERLPPRIRIAQILKNAKMRRLANEVETTGDSPAKTNAPKDEDVPDFVGRALGDGDVPKTFPLSDQYVNTIKKAKGAMEGCLSEPDSENPHEKSKKPKKSTKTQKKTTKREGKPKGEKVDSSWKYGEIRSSFIKSARGKGMDFNTAKSLWNESREKKELLAGLTLCELKRRKFVDKTCQANPWS